MNNNIGHLNMGKISIPKFGNLKTDNIKKGRSASAALGISSQNNINTDNYEGIGAKQDTISKDITYNTKFPDKKLVLTFDDGPNPKVTPKILDTLKKNNIKGAVFFVTGENAKRYPQLIKRIADEGHFLGNHTWDHPKLTDLSYNDKLRNFMDTEKAVQKALGKDIHLDMVRPPYGATDKRVKNIIHNQYDAKEVLWTFDTNDWRVQNKMNADSSVPSGGMLKNTLEELKDGKKGGVILMHDINPNTAVELPNVISTLQDRGYEFVSMKNIV